MLAAICGYNPNNLDVTRLPIYVNYTPSGTSVQNMAHWAQVRTAGGILRFRKQSGDDAKNQNKRHQ